MKKISVLILFILNTLNYAQSIDQHKFECNIVTSPYTSANWDPDYLGGQLKPESVERYTNDPNAYFPVLVVYVQFQDDPGPDWTECVWHRNQPPEFFNTVIATEKKTNINWWDAYDGNTETLSDYWMEVSRGKQHFVGKEVNVVLPHDVGWYERNGNIAQSMEDLFTALQNDPTIIWPLFDKWGKDQNGVWQYGSGDGFVDMMYVVARSNPCSQYNSWGYFRPVTPFYSCTHGGDHTVYNQNGVEIKLRASFLETGSGFQIAPPGCGSGGGGLAAPMPKWAVISFTGHEHGHYLFSYRDFNWLGAHQLYCKVNNYNGLEEYLSPYELIRMGYHTTQKVNYTLSSNYSINDWTSRDQNLNSQMLEVPIGDQNRNEFFIIANRQRVSHYDRIMWGDKAKDDPYNPAADGMAKGIYIYHAFPGAFGSGYKWQVPIDQECADGLFDWVQDGYQTPDWSNTQQVEYFKKVNVNYTLNDQGGTHFTGANGRDGKSLTVYSPLYGTDMYNWFGLGKKEVPPGSGNIGLDRIETNLIAEQPPFYSNPAPYEIWTNREWKGDRWDGWSVGYNEVFSPYSSPSTRDWDNNNTGIFIYLESQNGNQANLKIYKTGEGFNEDQILQLTPPSKPMNLKVEHCYIQPGTSYIYNKITWNHNLEPDMRREESSGTFVKKYNIYKVTSPNVNDLPNENNYSLLATVDINENLPPSYVDLSEPSGCHSYPDAKCPPICWTLHATRYRVQAVDVYETPSVKSDFASAFSFSISNIGGTETGDNPISHINSAPTEFKLHQNYPNPFNPTTDIKYELPKNSFVTIKIYNSLGEVVAVLTENEWKTTGRYSIKFDGSKYASGIYFYSITAGSFTNTQKMVLIK